MFTLDGLVGGFLLMFLLGTITTAQSEEAVKPPVAKKVPKKMEIHDHERVDNYYWLNDREDSEVIDYLKAENSYCENILKPTEKFQEKLYEEIVGRIKQNDESVPYLLKGYYYYTRYEQGLEYPLYCRKKGSLESEEEVMLNVNEMAKGSSYYRVAGVNIAPNSELLAFAVDNVGRRKYTIHFKDLTTGKVLESKIENTTGSVAWANDNKTVFYTIKDQALRSYKILRYEIGGEESVEVFHEADDTFSTFVYKSKSEKYIMVGSFSTLATEYRFLDADAPTGEFQVIEPRQRKHEYSVAHYGDKFYVVTNHEAKNFRLMETSVDKTTRENWKDVLPHRKDVLLENIEIFQNFLVVEERKDGLTHLRIMSWDKKEDYYIDFGESTYTAYVGKNPDFETNTLRYGYTSLTTPSSVYDFDMTSKEKTLQKQQEVVGDFDPKNYHAERLYAEADDGTKVPISLVYRKDKKKEDGNPLLLYGYGSYGYSIDAYFSSVRLSLLDRGFVYAIAHIRGGQEMGRAWYEDGKLLKKKNTFTDFIDCGEHLIAQKYTTKEQIFAYGGSAGGLLMGAVINLRPDLFKGVIAAVPFVDVVTTMLDDSIPLTTGEYDEWGNPNDKEYYEYILSYSPYDNIEAKDYPAMLVTTGLHDSQVQYWEPAKWVAKLRDLKTDQNILLMHTDMESGHSGTTGRFKRHKQTAMEYAFFFHLLGIYE